MKYLDEYRDPKLAQKLVAQIRARCSRRWTLMDVCGGQTHSLLRSGIEEVLQDSVELIHGPGCPVCVTPSSSIDFAQDLALREGVVLASFGDMLRVPGSPSSGCSQTLLGVRARGGQVQIVYSPLDAVRFAENNPNQQVVFFAVGFETTAPATALAVLQAERLELQNFSLLVSHVRVLPAMKAIMISPDNRVQAFLAAGHVCAVTGYQEYGPFVEEYRVPVVITGFEALDLLMGILEAIEQLEAGRPTVTNAYGRNVARAGNRLAQQAVQEVYQISDRCWRGFGLIAKGGLMLRERFQRFDAEHRFSPTQLPILQQDDPCLSADIMAGRIKPTECPHFGNRCVPDRPLGAPMVSSEGACAAYHRYQIAASNATIRTGSL